MFYTKITLSAAKKSGQWVALWLTLFVDSLINDLGNAYLSMSTYPVWSASTNANAVISTSTIFIIIIAVCVFNDAIVSAPLSFTKPSHLPHWLTIVFGNKVSREKTAATKKTCSTPFMHLRDHLQEAYYTLTTFKPAIFVVNIQVAILHTNHNNHHKTNGELCANATKFAVKCSEIKCMRRIPFVQTL